MNQSVNLSLKELREELIQFHFNNIEVLLNGFKESAEYLLSLSMSSIIRIDKGIYETK